MEKIYCAILI
jgi:hypothetical protein